MLVKLQSDMKAQNVVIRNQEKDIVALKKEITDREDTIQIKVCQLYRPMCSQRWHGSNSSEKPGKSGKLKSAWKVEKFHRRLRKKLLCTIFSQRIHWFDMVICSVVIVMLKMCRHNLLRSSGSQIWINSLVLFTDVKKYVKRANKFAYVSVVCANFIVTL